MAEALLHLAGVSKAFGGLKAVQDVSLAVAEGRLCALIGPNGAGKTTLFALMSGFLRPDSGTVRFAGQDITGREPHRNALAGMTRTFQIVKPFAAQTVRENIAVGAHLHIRSRATALGQAEHVAQWVGLAAQLDRPLWLIAESDRNDPRYVRPPGLGGKSRTNVAAASRGGATSGGARRST